KFCHHGAHPAKVAGSGSTLEYPTHCSGTHPDVRGIGVTGVHLLGIRSKHNIAPVTGNQLKISIQCARILLVVLLAVKLQRVYKYRGDDDVVLRAGLFKQCTVTIVQGPHSGNQPNFGGWVTGSLQCCNLLSNHWAYSINGGGELGLLVCHETQSSPNTFGPAEYRF